MAALSRKVKFKLKINQTHQQHDELPSVTGEGDARGRLGSHQMTTATPDGGRRRCSLLLLVLLLHRWKVSWGRAVSADGLALVTSSWWDPGGRQACRDIVALAYPGFFLEASSLWNVPGTSLLDMQISTELFELDQLAPPS